MEFRDYYKTLGVEPDADTKAIKSAYRKLARKYHPDVSDQHDAEERFKEVTEAYEVLGDQKKRAEYDELRQYGGRPGQSYQPPPDWQPSGDSAHFQGDFSDFFESIFGGGQFGSGRQNRTRQREHSGARGQDVEIELPIFLEDTLSESSQEISYSLPKYDANGSRLADTKKTLKVKIPKGVSGGERIRLKGQGVPGTGNAANGDLYCVIRLVPHPLFDVEAHNLMITVPLAPWEAALGTKITVPTLDGKIQLTIPPDSQSGKRLRIKGRGLPAQQGRGDLYAVLNVVMPPKTSGEDKKHWQALASTAAFDPRSEWSKVS